MDTDKLVRAAEVYWPWAAAPVGLYALTRFLSWLVPGPQHHRTLTFKDKTVVITGASTGLGRQLAIDVHGRGAKVIMLARSLDKLKELAGQLREMHPGNEHEPVCRYLDVSEPSGVEELPALAIDGKTIDILINNAGISMRGSIEDTPLEIQKQVMGVNHFGQIAVTTALLPSIPDDGSVILIGSVQGKIPVPYRSAYAASKHAAQAFFDTLRCESRPNLHILTVSAGYMNTGFGSRAIDVSTGKPTGKEDVQQLKGMPVEAASREILRAAAARETDLVMAPFVHRCAVFLRWAWPNLFFYLMYKRGLNDEYAKKK